MNTNPTTAFGGFSHYARVLAATLALAVVALVGGGGAQAASAQSITNEFGTLKTSKVTGHTSKGATFAGKYNVNQFVDPQRPPQGRRPALRHPDQEERRHQGRLRAAPDAGEHEATRAANATSALPTTSSTASTSAVSCDVLHLVLGPLDLDLLGLVVHLDKVVLDITAVPGAGALLGNLLCAVVGLLDGTGIGGLSGILTNLLNAILGILQA